MSFRFRLILFALAYWAGAELSYLLLLKTDNLVAFWPPAGLYLAMLLATPQRRWWAVILAASVPNFFSDAVIHHLTIPVSLGLLLINLGTPLVGAALVVRLCRPSFSFAHLPHVLRWSAIVSLISTPLSALSGATLFMIANGEDFGLKMLFWWLGDLLGVLLVTPLAYGVLTERPWLRRAQVVEAAALLLSLGAATAWVFRAPGNLALPSAVLFFFLLWAALRFSVTIVAAAATVLAVIAIWLTEAGFGPFSFQATATARLLMAQLLVITGALLFYILAAVMAERQAAEGTLRNVNVDLEQQVQARTAKLTATNEQLRESELRINAILQNTNSAIYLFDAENRFVHVNRLWEELFNLKADEVRGKSVYDLFSAAIADQFAVNNRLVIDSGKTIEFEEVAPLADGEHIYHTVKVPRLDADGKAYGIVGISTDITERKRKEQNLAFIATISRDFAPLSSVDEIIQMAGERIAAYFKLSHCVFTEINEAAGEAVVIYDQHVVDTASLVGVYRLADFHTEEERGQLASGTPVIINDVRHEPRSAASAAAFETLGIRALITAPYLNGGRWKFALSVQHRQPYQWNGDESNLLNILATQIYERVERSRAEAFLRDEEERFRLLTENAKDYAMVFIDNEMRITHWSSGAERILGWKEKEIIGQSAALIFTPEDRKNKIPEKEIATAKENGHARDERWHLRKDDSRFYGFGEMIALRDEAGSLRGFVKLFRDLTERKQAENRLRESEERFRTIFDSIDEGFCIIEMIFDADERPVDWLYLQANPAFEVLTGLKDSVGKRVREIVPDFEPFWFEVYGQVALTGVAVRFENEVEPLHRWFDVHASRVGDASSRRIAIVFNNITERKQSEVKLHASEVRYRRLFETAKDGILILNSETARITNANSYISELLGFSQAELLGKELWEIGLFKDMDESKAAVRELQENKYIRYEDLPLKTKAGHRADVEFVSNVYQENGHSVIQCNIRDITERKHAEAERERLLVEAQRSREDAETATRAKDEFLAVVSHELRNPLNSILGYARLLRTMPPEAIDASQIKKTVDIIERNGKAQLELINDLLDTARIISGKLKLEIVLLDLSILINDAVEVMRPAATAKNITILQQFDPGVGQIVGDPQRLQQIIWNLINNAVKFTQSGGLISVTLRRAGADLIIQVGDNGKGLSPDFLLQIFGRFTQADASATRRHGGLGLGLSLVKQLVELHGGEISAESEGEGKGTTFTIKLPVQSTYNYVEEARRSLTLSEPDRQMFAGLSVLVIDDDHEARELMTTLLHDYGADVTTVASAAGGFALLTDETNGKQFSVLISDIGMPEEDGHSLMRRFRKWERDRGQSLPAIAVTAFGRTEDRMAAMMAGFQMHVTKPVETEELIAVINSLLGRFN